MTEFKLKILTPEGVVYDVMAESVIVRTTVGDKGILAKHEPYVAALTIGQAKIRINGAVRIGAVSSGIVEVTKDLTTILAQSFEWSDEIDVDRAEKAKADLEKADDMDAIKKVMEELSKVSDPVMTKLYQANAAENPQGTEGTDGPVAGDPDDIK